jgi:hypothetical protein
MPKIMFVGNSLRRIASLQIGERQEIRLIKDFSVPDPEEPALLDGQ